MDKMVAVYIITEYLFNSGIDRGHNCPFWTFCFTIFFLGSQVPWSPVSPCVEEVEAEKTWLPDYDAPCRKSKNHLTNYIRVDSHHASKQTILLWNSRNQVQRNSIIITDSNNLNSSQFLSDHNLSFHNEYKILFWYRI